MGIPHRVEIDLFAGSVSLHDEGAAPLLDAIRDTISESFVDAIVTTTNTVSQQAGNNGKRLPWFVSAEIGRWPVLTGQSSGLIGRGLPIGIEEGELTQSWVVYIPPGTGLHGETLEYLAEIEHLGRGYLPPTFILRDEAERQLTNLVQTAGPEWARAAVQVI